MNSPSLNPSFWLVARAFAAAPGFCAAGADLAGKAARAWLWTLAASAEAGLDTGWERFCRTWIGSPRAGGIGAAGVAVARAAATGGLETVALGAFTLGALVGLTLATLTDAEAADDFATTFRATAGFAPVAALTGAASPLLDTASTLLAALAAALFAAERFAAGFFAALVVLRAVLAAVFAAFLTVFLAARADLALAATFARAEAAALRRVATLSFAALPRAAFASAPVFFAVLEGAPREFAGAAAFRLRTVFLVDGIRGTLLDRPALETGQGLAQPASRSLPADAAARAPDFVKIHVLTCLKANATHIFTPNGSEESSRLRSDLTLLLRRNLPRPEGDRGLSSFTFVKTISHAFWKIKVPPPARGLRSAWYRHLSVGNLNTI